MYLTSDILTHALMVVNKKMVQALKKPQTAMFRCESVEMHLENHDGKDLARFEIFVHPEGWGCEPQTYTNRFDLKSRRWLCGQNEWPGVNGSRAHPELLNLFKETLQEYYAGEFEHYLREQFRGYQIDSEWEPDDSKVTVKAPLLEDVLDRIDKVPGFVMEGFKRLGDMFTCQFRQEVAL